MVVPVKRIIEEDVTRIPPFLVALHRFVKHDLADRWGAATPSRYAQFDVTEILSSKWAALKDVEMVTILYRDPALKGRP